MKEIIIAGTGFTGAYIGRNLAEQGWKVKMLERRPQIAGQMFDKIDEETGCLVHEYGPHIFHTDDEDIWEWLNSFSEFTPFKLKTQVYFESRKDWFVCSFGFHTIEELYSRGKAEEVKKRLLKAYPNQDKVTIPKLLESEDPMIQEFVQTLWEDDYKPYTAKQWGIDPEDVDPDILKRVPVYLSHFDKIHNNKYEALPSEGYTVLFERILDHPNIEIELNVDAMDVLELKDGKVYYEGKESIVLFTGAIDELFDYKHGELSYRSLTFKKEVTPNDKNTKPGDPCVDIYPDTKYDYTRITNYGKVPIQNHLDYQISSKEYSHAFTLESGLERYYPMNTAPDKVILEKYLKEIDEYEGLYLSGRLADYKYYDMDKSLIAAREKLAVILDENK